MKAPAPSGKPLPDSKRLTQLLTDLGSDTVLDPASGGATTRDELLARTLWDMALGGFVTDPDTGEQRFHRPDRSVAMFILERREGKTPTAVQDESGRLSLPDRLTDLGRSRINSEADTLGAVPGDPGLLDGPDNGSEDSEDADD